MKVSRIIEHLKEYHKPDDYLMIDWLESDSLNGDGEMTQEIWITACQLTEQASESLIDRDYCASFVRDAQRESSLNALRKGR